jgi:hypothetical protein
MTEPVAMSVPAGQTTISVPMPPDGPAEEARWWRHNGDVVWDGFDPEAYWEHNYRSLRDDDRDILHAVGQFFADWFRRNDVRGGTGIDVGSGSNLYPALTMLPWCSKVLLTDHSGANVAWLGGEAGDARDTWEPFWRELVDEAGYEPVAFAEARRLLQGRTVVEQRSVFEMSQVGAFDVGTMFFVAESLTNYPDEFLKATSTFLSLLKPGAPFAAAFMDSSLGYFVGEESFPATEMTVVGAGANSGPPPPVRGSGRRQWRSAEMNARPLGLPIPVMSSYPGVARRIVPSVSSIVRRVVRRPPVASTLLM